MRRWLDLVSDISSRDEAGKAARCEKHPSEAWQPRMCSDELESGGHTSSSISSNTNTQTKNVSDELETIPFALLKQIILLSNSNK